jgi:outer membrane protein assembly factor BamB
VLLAVAALALSFAFYWGFARETPLPPLEPSATRTMDTGSAAWPAPAGGILWRTRLGSPIVAAVAATEQIVYVSLADARMVALSVADGRELWSVPTPGQMDAPPAVAGDRIYLGLRDGRVVSLDANTGAELWSKFTVHGIHTSLAVDDGVVWVTSLGAVLALDAENGALLWIRQYSAAGAAAGPAVADDRIAAYTGNQILVFDPENGGQTSYFQLPRLHKLLAMDRTVVAQSESIVVSIDSHSLRPWWEGFRRIWRVLNIWDFVPAPPPPPHNWVLEPPRDAYPAAIDPLQVILANPDGVVQSYGLRSGELLWERSIAAIAGTPVRTRDGLLIPHADALTLLDAGTGQELWRRVIDAGLRVRALTVTPGGTFLVTDSEELLALR